MTDWTEGYVAEVGYTYGYYAELNPIRAAFAFENAGLVFPKIHDACELGFGQGLSINLHAAASTVRWAGTDFNPAHAAHARDLCAAAQSDARLYEDSFAEFTARTDLPDFDYIGIHGIWSWVSPENQAVLADFVRRRLKIGGVLYISYNTLPGWSAQVPMRHILFEHARLQGAAGAGILARTDAAIQFTKKLLDVNPAFARAYPQTAERLKSLEKQNPHYVAHEYLNREWHPMFFSTFAEKLASAKLTFACSMHLIDHIDGVNLSVAQRDFMKEITDPIMRETVRDYMLNVQFRRDLWVRGARRLKPVEQVERLRKRRFVLVSHRPDVSLKLSTPQGEANLNQAIYGAVLDALADHRPRSIGELEKALAPQRVGLAALREACLVLTGSGHLAPTQDDDDAERACATAARLNAEILGRALASADIGFLASPVTGGAVAVNRLHQLFLLARSRGMPQSEWPRFAFDTLKAQGQRLVSDGKALETDQENLDEITTQTRVFADKQLPILLALRAASTLS